MLTGHEILSKLPVRLQLALIKEIEDQEGWLTLDLMLAEQHRSISSFIRGGFTWVGSRQNYDFWIKITESYI